MSKLNFLVYLNAYDDQHSSNAPNRSNFKWERNANSIFANNPTSLEFSMAPGETRTLFNGQRTLTQDNTTQYTLSLVPFTMTTYQIKWVGGTSPRFRTARVSGANSSTNVTVTVNGPVATFASGIGQPFDLISGGVVVGDSVRIGSNFSPANQGEWKIISMTNTSFSVANPLAVAEGPINLGSSYNSQVDIYSAAGVQVNDTLIISGGFSPASWGSYTITAVSDTFIQFSSLNALPQESSITTQAIAAYFIAKKLIYMESDQHVTMAINGASGNEINPLVTCGCNGLIPNKQEPGMFLRTSTVYSISITNVSINTANLFFASVE